MKDESGEEAEDGVVEGRKSESWAKPKAESGKREVKRQAWGGALPFSDFFEGSGILV